MDKFEKELREQLVQAGRKLVAAGYVQSDGNLSVRIPNTDEMIITPAGIKAGVVTVDQLLTVDFDGNIKHGEGKPSSGVPMHSIIYRLKPGARCVIHGHPPFATSFAVAGKPIPNSFENLELALGGEIPCTKRYEIVGTHALAKAVGDVIGSADAVLLKNHGVLVFGDSIEKAARNFLSLEKCAQIVLYASLFGEPPLISKE